MVLTRTHPFTYAILLLLCFTAARNTFAQLPTWDWVRQAGGTGRESSRRLYLSPEGDVYISGVYNGSAQFGNLTLSATHSTGYLARYDSTGSVIWVRDFPASIRSGITSATCDTSGNMYLVGQFTGQIVLGTQTFTSISTSNDGQEGFVAKMSSSGTIEWAEHLQGRRRPLVTPFANVEVISVAFDATNALYVAGFCTDSLYLGQQTSVAGGGAQNAFLFRIDPQLHRFQWVTVAEGRFRSYAYDMKPAPAPQGGVIINGDFNGTIRFGTSAFNSGASACGFFASYDANGQLQWLKKSDPSTTNANFCSASNALKTPAGQSGYLCGYYIGQTTFGGMALPNSMNGDSHAFITKYDAAGNVEWAQASMGGPTARANGVATDPSGNLYVSGYFQGTLTFGALSLVGDLDSLNGYLLKLDPQGTPQWLLRVGAATTTAYIVGIRMSPINHRLYVNGSFNNSVPFGATTLVSAGGLDNFLARLSVGIPLGSSEATEAGEWSVAPNPVPAGGRVRLSWPQQAQLERLRLLDGTGRTVYAQSVTSASAGQLELVLPPLAPGLYLLQAVQESRKPVWKRIVIGQ